MIKAYRRLMYRLNSIFVDSIEAPTSIRDSYRDKALQIKHLNEIRYSFPMNPNALLVERHKLSFGEHFYQYISIITPLLSLLLMTSIPCYLLYYNSLVHHEIATLSLVDIARYVNGQAPKPCDNIIAIYYLRKSWNLNFLYRKFAALRSDSLLVALIDCHDKKGLPVELEKALLLDGIAIHFYKFTSDNDVSYAQLDSNLQTTELINQIKKLI
ncbi:hypothetical protein BMR1_02g02165 [Babesia microti strain RI]|uniref:Uncharacterized protein n=1 Tax=Babesia microti (strain RI) TaxID=1133968 RepID=I7IGB9_BABMR|nr:hypothetical protein BMR1_02g02165 [Babesia microti strain RI]CCF73591.1 hypothetical protein BMR1_02g02165 [Babesia microti strain RI]|eukprot:XP_012648200.1 hypothetical protein BMR1_02g02165 [Babesia microti strain RI]